VGVLVGFEVFLDEVCLVVQQRLAVADGPVVDLAFKIDGILVSLLLGEQLVVNKSSKCSNPSLMYHSALIPTDPKFLSTLTMSMDVFSRMVISS
jgi:hypothetical protein